MSMPREIQIEEWRPTSPACPPDADDAIRATPSADRVDGTDGIDGADAADTTSSGPTAAAKPVAVRPAIPGIPAIRAGHVATAITETPAGAAESAAPSTTEAPEAWAPPNVDRDIEMLGDVLHAVVHGGAGVSFFLPFTPDAARAFWRDKVLPAVCARTRRVLLARDAGHIVGTVQLDLATPPNQRHRADVAKLLVHPDARRRGVARALMARLEAIAREERRTLLTLDTVTGSDAEPLYLSLGFTRVGVIPGYARGALTPELESTTIMYKQLDLTEPSA